jgi:sec-independent protein translocase protein TatA
MGNLGVPEILIILLLLLVFFGAKKIPEMAQGLGKGIKEFRKAAREVQADQESEAPPVAASISKAETVTCMYCRAEIPKGAQFCPTCGKSQEPLKCSKCNAVNAVGNKFCSECGEKLTG